jgi:NAD+ synthase (glutamine-hydrolysing)
MNLFGKKLAVTICEDIWNTGNENPLYPSSPMEELAREHPDLMINLSASPFDVHHFGLRKAAVTANVSRYGIPMFYCNQIGAQTELIFDGSSMVMRADGKLHDVLPAFDEAVRTFDTASVFNPQEAQYTVEHRTEVISMHDALVLGIRDYFRKLGFRKAVLGLSGGIDSALVLALAAEALGSENVHCLLMPSAFSSTHSIDDAVALCKNLGCPYDVISIESLFNQFQNSLAPYFRQLPFDVTEENLQARIRGNLLMAFANKFGYILLNTTNKSEMAVGYGTLYGDMAGGLSVIGDVYKSQVYQLADYMNRHQEVIPAAVLHKAPSAELRPGQKDSDSLPPYDQLDPLLVQYIEHRKGPRELIDMGFDETLVRSVLRMVNTSEFKRHQAAPVLRVSPKAFGMGRRMPIVGKYLS